MSFKKYSFAINSYHQAVKTINACHNRNILPIIYIKYFIVDGFGSDWLKEFNNLLIREFPTKNFKIYVDCKKNYGLFINLVEQKINYLKIDSIKENLKKLNQIAKKNKVLLNPQFSIIDLSKIKNIDLKINRILTK